MLFLNQGDMEACASFEEIMERVEAAYKLYMSGDFFMPERPSVEYKNKTLLYMPCFKEDLFGTKILTVFPDNRELGVPAIDGLMLLNDYSTGKPLAMLDGKALTSLRTGAVGAVGVRYLSSENSKTVGIIGAGVQGFYQALYACTVRNIEKVYIYDAYVQDLTSYKNRLKEKLNEKIQVVICDSAEQLLKNAEIIITTTTANQPVLPDNPEVLAGKCFIGVGSYKPTMREYPDSIWTLVENAYIDLEFAIEESGDLSQPIDAHVITKDKIKLLGELIIDQERKPIKKGETTFFKTVGMALFDLSVAQYIYEKALEKKIGQNITM